MFPPVSRTPSPAIPDPVIHHNSRNDSFPVDWFFNENAPPISKHKMENLKDCKKNVIMNNDEEKNPSPLNPSQCTKLYKKILSEKKS